MDTFTFKNPDKTIQILNIQELFPSGASSLDVREFGVKIAERFPAACEEIAARVNAMYRTHSTDGLDFIDPSESVERIGHRLGQYLWQHIVHGEETADIWQEVTYDYMCRAANNGNKVNIYVIDDNDKK